MRMNNCNRSGSCIIMRCYSNCSELGYNAYIYKKNKETFNIYNFNRFQLIFGIVMDLFGKKDEQCEKVADSLV